MKKLSFQKIFCFISFLFILSCCIFYGTRFIKYYIEEQKIEIAEANTLIKKIKENNNNKETFKEINDSSYFINNATNNYLMYSNILWRIIKINNDNSITAISDSSLTSLAYGEYLNYQESYVNQWLNSTEEDYTGILEKNLNNKETYLQKTKTCIDIIDTLNNDECKNNRQDSYISLLETKDFINVGNQNSYIVNNEQFYLVNSNTNKETWFVDEDGNVKTNKGTDIIGIRPVITIKSNIDYQDGNGSKENPYKIEKENGLFGSFVKLDNQMWRIYQVNENDVRLVLDDYLKVNDTELTHIYGTISSYHNDDSYNSIAYYLNHTFLNKLSYKNKIKEVTWTNGYYGSSSEYDYTTALNKTIKSKVGLISMGDIILNSELNNYFTLTGTKEKGSMVYAISKNKKLYGKSIQSKINVVPTISLDKTLLTKGNGTKNSPYEME